MCALMGCDYQVYYCVAILSFLQPSILNHTHTQSLTEFLRLQPLAGFTLAEALPFISTLHDKYHAGLHDDMLAIARESV